MSTSDVAREVWTDDGIVETYHGVQVSNPFRWLEEHGSARTRAWIDEQAKRSRNYLDNLQGREALNTKVQGILDQENIGEISKLGDSIIYTKRRRGEEQSKLYRCRAGYEELLLDPAALGEGNSLSISLVDISPNGKLVAYGLRLGGRDTRSVRILNLDTGETLPDTLPEAFVRGFAFLPKSDGYFYVIETAGERSEPKSAKLHIFGRDTGSDEVVFYAGRASDIRLIAGFDPASSTAVLTVIRAIAGENLTSVHLQKLDCTGNFLTTLLEESTSPWDVRIKGDQLFVFLDQDDGVGRKLLRIPLSTPHLRQSETILTEGSRNIQSWHIIGDRILTVEVENLASMILVYSLTGEDLGAINLPGAGTAGVLGGDASGCFFDFQSYTQARQVYYYDFRFRSHTLFSCATQTLDRVTARRIEYPAEDGTLIPITLLGRSDVLDFGQAPVLLTAYGSGGMSLTPQYSTVAACMVSLGGIFAIAHIRGGGEHGLSWAEAGKRHNRPTVHKDFLAAADFLLSSGMAAPDRVAIAGGSNSGLLVATAMTQRPELFRAVVCLAPITDMLRYHHFRNTQFYIPQFGHAEDPEDFPVLLSYSPYHNVCDAVRYPALLMISGDSDTRCDPMHARKFVARLQAAMSALPQEDREECPILFDWNPLRGHFPGLPLASRVRAIVDRLLFLCYHLGMEVI